MIEQIRQATHIFKQTKMAWLSISGGMLIVLGSWLPWFSLFAGLQPYHGVDVVNGRLLLGGGVFSITAGVWLWRHSGVRLRWSIGLWGFLLLAFAAWSLLQLLFIYRQLDTDPLMVVGLGPGLFVVIGGASLIFATLFVE